MSGIVGVVDFSGAPVDRALVRSLTDSMAFRGPDAQEILVDGAAGFGHAQLRTSEESDLDLQPFTLPFALPSKLDDQLWIVADARLDVRSELITRLTAAGECVVEKTSDAELILRAYRVWAEGAVDRLLGDFAFAIWDKARRRLFLARDHLGVKALYYARLGSCLVFSNSSEVIRRHPCVSEKLNDQAIADFLLAGLNYDPATTSFSDIQRIPPAYFGVWSEHGQRVARYWSMPIDEPIRFKRPEEYTERFRELVGAAVRDRLRGRRSVALLMSGGLDSPTLAATACRILRGRSAKAEVHAFTTLAGEAEGTNHEKRYARIVADHLHIPIQFVDHGSASIRPDWSETGPSTVEPSLDVLTLAADRALYQRIAAQSRVLFYGEGPDNALSYEWKPYMSYMMGKGAWGTLVLDLGRHVLWHRRIPLVTTIPALVKLRLKKDGSTAGYPGWLNPVFEARLGLADRWLQLERMGLPDRAHPLRPAAYASFHSPLWESLFRSLDAGDTRAPMETRHPFVDLRVLRYMLAVPAMPWCRIKYLERRAMSGILPKSVLDRPKSPLAVDPIFSAARRWRSVPQRSDARLSEYVDLGRMAREPATSRERFWLGFRPLALNHWLQNLAPRELVREDLNNEVVGRVQR